MFDTEYTFVHNKRKSRNFEKLSEAVNAGAEKLRRPSRVYRVGVEGQNAGRQRLFADAKDRVTHHLGTFPLGTVIRMEAYGSDGSEVDQTRWRKVQVPVQIPDGPGVEGIDRWAKWLSDNYAGNGTFRFAGICVCKPDSDHQDCAACDNFDTWPNMAAQVHESLVNASYYHTKYTILKQTIYFPDGHGGWTSKLHTGAYHAHVHLSVNGGVPGAAC